MRSRAALPTWLLVALLIGGVVTSMGLLIAPSMAIANERNPALTRPAARDAATERIIIKFRDASRPSIQGSSAARLRALADRSRFRLDAVRSIGGGLHVIHVSSQAEVLEQLSLDGELEFAVPDRRVYAHATSNDPIANRAPNGQWYLRADQPSAINAHAAWDITRGSDGVVIAVVDSGVRFDHPDIRRSDVDGRLLAGYDFVSQDAADIFVTSNDGDSRDTDASDPGDYCGQGSSWHGTRVAGIIGALTNNGVGVAGINWNAHLLPVRVLGRCGGYISDVLAGIRWAAGLPVPGVLDNPTPAQIINVSLGAEGACEAAAATTIRDVTATGALVVVSAGNEGGPVDSPANCPGAMAIAGVRNVGTKVGFSSLGPQVALSAPGGNCVNTGANEPCLFSIDTTLNLGVNGPTTDDYTTETRSNVGTSFSAPIVSGIAGLMLAVNGNLRSNQLVARMRDAAKPFPAGSGGLPVCHTPINRDDLQTQECVCTQAVCGAGMANAFDSVNQALRPIAAISAPQSVSPGQAFVLDGAGSAAACGASISSYLWTVVSGSVSLSGTNTPTVSLQPPSGSDTARVRLTVTDNSGRTDSVEIAINPTSTAVEGPQAAGTTACLSPRKLPPFITLSSPDNAAEEGASGDTATLRLTRTGSTADAITVFLDFSGSATVGADYQSLPATVDFAPGETTEMLTVVSVDDSAGELPETLVASVRMGSGYSVAADSRVTINLTDDDYQQLSVTALDTFSVEETADVGTFQVSRSGKTIRPLTVTVSYSGTATSGSDYQAMPTTLIFPVGTSALTVTMTPIDDPEPDNNETVVLNIEPASHYVVHPPAVRAIISIRDAETPEVTIRAPGATVAEQAGGVGTFILRRTGNMTHPVVVRVETAGTATPGADYQSIAASYTIPAGQAEASFTVTPIDDTLAERDEGIIVSLMSGAGYDVGLLASAIVTIIDDDRSPPAPAPAAAARSEGGGGSVDLLLLMALSTLALYRLNCRYRASRRAAPPASGLPVSASREYC